MPPLNVCASNVQFLHIAHRGVQRAGR